MFEFELCRLQPLVFRLGARYKLEWIPLTWICTFGTLKDTVDYVTGTFPYALDDALKARIDDRFHR